MSEKCPTCQNDRPRRICAAALAVLGFAFIFNGLVLWDHNTIAKERNVLLDAGLKVPPSEVKALVEEVKTLIERHDALLGTGVAKELHDIHREYPVYLREMLVLLRKANNLPTNHGEPDPEYGVPPR